MNPFAAMAVKLVGGGTTAALMTLGLTASLADASVMPTPAPASSNPAVASPYAGVRDAVRFAVFESEADVLRIPQAAFLVDLKRGITVARLARERGLNKDQFGDRLVVNLKPRLAQLVHLRVITKAEADRVVDRINHGYIPWWDGLNK
ncbi:MAG TPA: hypothetical protein VNU19_12080 [Candidatus Acidoferrum sp.]|jgi:hypothetical protein|nr:hypothetical protein [Candidatus Acidoferrum sp.]